MGFLSVMSARSQPLHLTGPEMLEDVTEGRSESGMIVRIILQPD